MSRRTNQLGGQDADLDYIMKKMFDHQTIIKMLHFQTKRYGWHKELDCYLCKFTANFDRFMESAQGRLNMRVATTKIETSIKMLTEETTMSYLNQFTEKVLNGAIESAFGKDKGLSAIRDEMVTDVDQLKYLLTFK